MEEEVVELAERKAYRHLLDHIGLGLIDIRFFRIFQELRHVEKCEVRGALALLREFVVRDVVPVRPDEGMGTHRRLAVEDVHQRFL